MKSRFTVFVLASSLALAIIFPFSTLACDLSEVTLVSYTDNGTSHDYEIQVCIGGGILGVDQGANGDTRSITVSVFKSGSTVTLSGFTGSITSTETGITMNATAIGPVAGNPDFGENSLFFAHPGGATDPFTCISSTALCGNPQADCFNIQFTSDVYLDSLKVFGVEGNNNPYGGCLGEADMMLNFLVLLPVELSHFQAKQVQTGIELSWETLQETNNRHFVIERSNDGLQFESLGMVPGEGHASSPRQYAFQDHPSKGGSYFYRLKQVDYSGEHTYSQTLVVHFQALEEQFSLYVDPVQETLAVIAQDDLANQAISLLIYDPSGRIVSQKPVPISQARSLSMSNWSPGVYIVVMTSTRGVISRKRFIKTR